jgi:hypothetical protein
MRLVWCVKARRKLVYTKTEGDDFTNFVITFLSLKYIYLLPTDRSILTLGFEQISIKIKPFDFSSPEYISWKETLHTWGQMMLHHYATPAATTNFWGHASTFCHWISNIHADNLRRSGLWKDISKQSYNKSFFGCTCLEHRPGYCDFTLRLKARKEFRRKQQIR